MDTQLVRHDKPYNVICGNNGRFALHIATLMVITEVEQKDIGRKVVEMVPMARCYPVVGGSYKADGEVWMNEEQKDCLVVCREGEAVSLHTLKRVMEFCAKTAVSFYTKKMPHFFSGAMLEYGCKILLPTENGKTVSDYDVCLVFEESNNGSTCMVYADKDSDFFFNDYFVNEPEFISLTSSGLPTNLESIRSLAELRDNYLQILKFDGLRNIKFITKNNAYQWFVDKLNDTEVDE